MKLKTLAVLAALATGLSFSTSAFALPAALQQAGLPGAVFLPLAGEAPPYEMRCLWRAGSQSAALLAFLDAVRGFAQPTE